MGALSLSLSLPLAALSHSVKGRIFGERGGNLGLCVCVRAWATDGRDEEEGRGEQDETLLKRKEEEVGDGLEQVGQ